jgi:hypothetical protein
LLPRLLSGPCEELEPLRPEPVASDDGELDPVQQEAVARALHTPDVCVIQGLPGTGKSRVVAEILAQAAARGERVLFLASTAAALDGVLQRLTGRDAVFALRCMDRNEALQSLAPNIRRLTFAERARFLTEQALPAARRQAEFVGALAARLQKDKPVWERLLDLADSRQQVAEQAETLRRRGEQIPGEVEQEAANAAGQAACSPFTAAVSQHAQIRAAAFHHLDTVLTDLRGQAEAGQKEKVAVAEELAALHPLAEAKEHGRWWTSAWWRATLHKGTTTRAAELAAQLQQLELTEKALEEQITGHEHERQQADDTFQAACTRLIAEETQRRLAEVDLQAAALQRDADLLRQKWQARYQELASEVNRPEEFSPTAVQAARDAWQRQLERAEEQKTFAGQWVAYLEQSAQALSARLPSYVNVVAATLTALPADEHFGDRSGRGPAGSAPFDLLVLDEADQVSEAELLSAARRARRWVLVGEPARAGKAREDEGTAAKAPPTPAPARNLSLSRSHAFERLWRHLHCDPYRLPYAWTREAGRLCCRLRAVSPAQRAYLETEQVADFPDIELRILTLPRGQPALAEIVFPPAMTIDQAKQYVFRELQELPVRAAGHSLRWLEEPERLVLQLGGRPCRHEAAVDLEPGVRESLGSPAADVNGDPVGAWHTCCLEFDRSAGWHRDRAEDWVHQYLGLRDLGRTIRLDVLHRMAPGLAAFVSDCLFAGAAVPPAPAADQTGAAVEFVSVPPSKGSESGRGKEAERGSGSAAAVPSPPLSRKGGAGLELDLSDPRHRDRLPAEVRTGLPPHGFVNYAEAQAVVRMLARFVTEPARRIAVLTLYEGQAELIRRLMQRDSRLAAAGGTVDVVVGNAFGHREAAVVLLSLTRSHTHRAVAFGENPQALALALSRARQKLVLFGDPGTLIRRSQWEGPLEHLDEAAAGQERDLITRLARYLQGQGRHRDAFHFHPGNGL